MNSQNSAEAPGLAKPKDSIVEAVVQKFLQRSEFGIKKYGVTLDRTDLSLKDWIQHTQEELMDAILYLEKLKHSTELGFFSIVLFYIYQVLYLFYS